ncbi:glucosaminidase domain-containing protein [Candidatus Gottesmanbacteria bacterium]|nr:glucosaminidase domain-containing protein [Candidatus Gottesmanbacteria bacterium]
MKNTITVIITLAIFGLMAKPVMAQNVPMAEASAHLPVTHAIIDERVTKLKAYLETHNSPLADQAGHFVAEADRLQMDWKLVAAIAGVESTFGKHVPANSYNGWGWAIYTGQSDGRHFDGWKDGITVVSEGLRYNYMDKGLITIEQMGKRYAASPTWSMKVRFFLDKIENFNPTGVEHLAVTI